MPDPSWRIFVCAVTASLTGMGHNGGCHSDEGDPLPSPAHALALVLEMDGEVEAELVLVSTATEAPTHIDGASVGLLVGTASAVPLSSVAPGTYAVDEPQLAYEPNESYTFTFELDETTARSHRAMPGAFQISIHGGIAQPQAWITDADGLEVAWSPAGARVLIDVFDADGARTYATIDWDDAAIDASTWRNFPEGGTLVLPESARSGVAPHRVRVCAVEIFRRDGEPKPAPQHALEGEGLATGLGWLSGGVAGRCVSIEAE
jgi:hypothetical protein